MTEFVTYIPVLSLLVGILSVIVAILTYLRVTRKYISDAYPFSIEIKPIKQDIIFSIKGTGVLQKIEFTAKGSAESIVKLSVDNIVFLNETFMRLLFRKSKYLTVQHGLMNWIGQFDFDMNLQKNYFKKIELSIENKHQSNVMIINGIVYYNILEPRFRLFSKN
jgi:hypothetical protein